MKVKSESEVAQLCPTLATPWAAAYQAPPSMGFSRQEYWSGGPLPSPDEGENEDNDRLFSWAHKSLQRVTATMKLKDACSLEEKL